MVELVEDLKSGYKVQEAEKQKISKEIKKMVALLEQNK